MPELKQTGQSALHQGSTALLFAPSFLLLPYAEMSDVRKAG